MPETQSAIATRFESTLHRAVRIEPLLGLVLGALSGVAYARLCWQPLHDYSAQVSN
jgi:hypothetical protein